MRNGVDFGEFLRLAGITPTECAAALGIEPSTVTRWRDKTTDPSGPYLLRVTEWANKIADEQKLPEHLRLSWDYIRDNGAAA